MPRKLEVVITGDARQLERTLGRAGTEVETFGSKVKGMGKTAALAAGAAGLGAIVIGLKDSLQAAEEAQAAHALLSRAFKNVGLDADKYASKIDGATAAGRNLGFKNVDVLTSLAKLITPTKDVGKAMKDLEVAENLARVKHIGLQAASQILTGALAGNQRAVKQLGIVVPPVTSAVDALKRAHQGVKGPIDSTALAHAKLQDKLSTGERIIDVLSGKIRGQSQAFSQTAAGGMATFSAQLDNIEEKLGEKLLPILQSVVTFINSNWGTIGSVLSAAFSAANIAVQSFITPMKALWDLVHGDWAGAWDAIKAPAVAAWDAIKTALQPVIDLITGSLTSAMTAIQSTAETVWAAVSGAVSTSVTAMKTAVDTVWTPMKDGLQTAMRAVRTTAENVWSAVSGAVEKAFQAAKTAFDTIWNVWFGSIKTELQWIGDAGAKVWSTLSNAANTAFSAIGGFVTNIWEGAYGKLKSGLTWIKDHASEAWNALSSAIKTVAGGIESMLGGITSAINGVIGALKDIIGWAKDAWNWLSKVAGGGPGHNDPGNKHTNVGPGGAKGYIPESFPTDFFPPAVSSSSGPFAGGASPLDDTGVGGAVSSGSSGEPTTTGDLVGDSAYAAALRKRHGPWEPPKRWAPDEMRTGSVYRAMLERRFGNNIHFEDAWVQALYQASMRTGQIMSRVLNAPPNSISDLTSGQVWYDFPGGQWKIPALASGGRLLSDGLYYGHKGETVSPASVATPGALTTHVTVELDGAVVGRAVTNYQGRRARYGGPAPGGIR